MAPRRCTTRPTKPKANPLPRTPIARCRKSYTKEYKLKILDEYHSIFDSNAMELDNTPSLQLTANRFALNNGITLKMLLDWLEKELPLRKHQHLARKMHPGRKPALANIENQLAIEVRAKRQLGARINQPYVIAEAKRMLFEHQQHIGSGSALPDFKFSSRWFYGFCKRKHFSLRMKTHQSQKLPKDYLDRITAFIQYIRQQTLLSSVKKDVGHFTLGNINNMDQIPIVFEWMDGKTLETTGAKSVTFYSQRSGFEKRQCTVQLTVSADGVMRVKPLCIFRGVSDSKLLKAERYLYDKDVVVTFQKKAWCDEKVMEEWLRNQWRFCNADMSDSVLKPMVPRLLVLDAHSIHRTEKIKELYKKLNTTVAMIPGGCTSMLQPLDVCINKPFKDRVKRLATEHYNRNIEQWSAHKDFFYSASQRRILITKWVGQAWRELHQDKSETIIRSFKKCGISTAPDGSEDDQINIRGLELTDLAIPVVDDALNDIDLEVYADEPEEEDSDDDEMEVDEDFVPNMDTLVLGEEIE
jgi:hypothetical protein